MNGMIIKFITKCRESYIFMDEELGPKKVTITSTNKTFTVVKPSGNARKEMDKEK